MRRKTGRFLAGCMAAFVAMTSSYVPVAAEETDSVIAPKEGAYGYYVEKQAEYTFPYLPKIVIFLLLFSSKQFY